MMKKEEKMEKRGKNGKKRKQIVLIEVKTCKIEVKKSIQKRAQHY